MQLICQVAIRYETCSYKHSTSENKQKISTLCQKNAYFPSKQMVSFKNINSFMSKEIKLTKFTGIDMKNVFTVYNISSDILPTKYLFPSPTDFLRSYRKLLKT